MFLMHIKFCNKISVFGAYFFAFHLHSHKTQIHYPNEILVFFSTVCVCVTLWRVHSSYHTKESQMLLMEGKGSLAILQKSLDNGCLIFFNQIMSYTVIWAPQCVAAVVHECIKEYLPSTCCKIENLVFLYILSLQSSLALQPQCCLVWNFMVAWLCWDIWRLYMYLKMWVWCSKMDCHQQVLCLCLCCIVSLLLQWNCNSDNTLFLPVKRKMSDFSPVF